MEFLKRGTRRLAAPSILTGLALAAGLLVGVPRAQAAPCSPADLNGDGQIDFADYLAFLNFYDAGDLTVDYNGDGMVDFSDYLEFLNLYDAGCATCSTTSTELACVPLASYPFANFANAYLSTSLVNVAVDPFKYPTLTGKSTKIYITANQTWSTGMPLTDVRGGPQTVVWPGGTVSANTVSLTGSSTIPFDAGETVGIGYDIVIDENNNGVFDSCDFVDGAGAEAGFYKFKDLTINNAGTPVTMVASTAIPVGRCAAGFELERWYYPSDIGIRGQLPLVIISHGNGHMYTWYDHLGNLLASYGMIVMAHQNQTAAGDGVPSASTTLLDHYNTLISLQGTLQAGILNGHIKQSETYWIGHSRGGECVAYGWDRLNRGLYTPTGGFARVINASDVKWINSISPTEFAGLGRAVGGGTAFTDPGPTDFMLIYGASDGDVSGAASTSSSGLWSFSVLERADQRRNCAYFQGVGHNEFNCCGFADATGPALIGRTAAQAIQKAVTLASILHWRQGNVVCGEVISRQYETFKPGATLATAVIDLEYKDFGASRKFVIDDFQTNPATNLSSSGGAVNFTVTNLVEGFMRNNDTTYSWTVTDPFNGMSRARAGENNTFGLVFDYDNTVASRNITWDVVPAGQDTTPYKYISFRAAQITQHPFTLAVTTDQDFQVELEDNLGNKSAINISTYGGGIEETYTRSGGWADEFETIRIRLADFQANGRTLDLSHITKARMLFGSSHGTNQGRLGMDDLEFTK